MSTEIETRRRIAAQIQAVEQQTAQLRAFVGLDGFVDEILHLVDKRQDVSNFHRIPTIHDFATRVEEASGRSTNMELVTQRIKLGGNGPIMANALVSAGVQVSYLVALGFPDTHPVFQPLVDRATKVFSVANPGHTDAYEFEDGKLLMGKLTPLNDMCWDKILERMGKLALAEQMEQSDLVAFVNWTMLPFMSQVWSSIHQEILEPQPLAEGQRKKRIFFDLCDPQKRPQEDILEALQIIQRFQSHFSVCLGLNEKECYEIAEVLGLDHSGSSRDQLMELVSKMHQILNLDTLVVHPVRYAVASNRKSVVSFEGPFIAKPVITTGAGDHFNAGFCLGQLLGFDEHDSLACGVSTSGFYVKTGKSPALSDLVELLNQWPE